MILNFGATDNFFTNNIYFFSYEEYHHEFQIRSREIIIAYSYKDIVLRLVDLDGSKVTCIVKKISWTPLLGHFLLNIIFFARKRVEVFF